MEPGTKIRTVPSSNTPNPSCPTATSFTPPNPYARDPSRRAIACVTCAKAKTRCDKALPSCSRCISKGIKCDPRSTRRTSDNTYRTLSCKRSSFVAPKRFTTPGILPSSSSSRSTPSTRPRSIMRAPSHIDFRTAVKMSQQAAIKSGVPKFDYSRPTTYQSHIVDECFDYTPSPEPDLHFTPDIEQDSFPYFSRGGTPQTPPTRPFRGVYQLDTGKEGTYLDCDSWTADGLGPVGLEFGDLDMSMGMPMSISMSMPMGMDIGMGIDMGGEWMTPTPEPEDMDMDMDSANIFAPTAQTQTHTQIQREAQMQTGRFSTPMSLQNFDSLASLPATDWIFDGGAPSKAGDEALDSGIVMQAEWPPQAQAQAQSQLQLQSQQKQDLFVDMGLVTSAPYVPKMQGVPGVVPVWEDVFMPGALAY